MLVPRFIYHLCKSLTCGRTRAMQLTGERTREDAELYEAAECLTCGKIAPFAFVLEHPFFPLDEGQPVLRDYEEPRRWTGTTLPS
jgi:hypothetical protein